MTASTTNTQEETTYPKQKQALAHLTKVLEPLAYVDDNYPQQIYAFIESGNNPDILNQLSHLPDLKAPSLLDFPGTYAHFWNHVDLTHKETRAQRTSVNYRIRLYKCLFEGLSPEQIVRYAKFLQAVTKQENYTELSANIPIWFSYLVVDGLCTSLDRFDRKTSRRDNWTCEYLLGLLTSEAIDNPDDVLLSIMFERSGVEEYYTENLNAIYRLTDTLAFLEKNKHKLDGFIPQLSAKGQKQFINDFAKNNPEFIKTCPQLVVTLIASNSKTVRELAVSKLGLFDNAVVRPFMEDLLVNGSAKQRREMADILARSGEDNRATLENALANEKQKSVKDAIQSALSRLDSQAQAEEVVIKFPPVEPIVSQDIPASFAETLANNYQLLFEKKRIASETEIEENKTAEYKSNWIQEQFKSFKKLEKTDWQSVLNAINGSDSINRLKKSDIQEVITYKKQLQTLPEFGLHHATRILLGYHGNNWWFNWLFDLYHPEHLQSLELRQLAQMMTEMGLKQAERNIAAEYLEDRWEPQLARMLNQSEQVVPFFTENIDLLAEALGLLPSKSNSDWNHFLPLNAISILEKFEHIPKQFIPKLLELALGENKRVRTEAQNLLIKIPNIHERAIEGLANGKQAIRITAVEWLARMHIQEKLDTDAHKQSIKALYALLKKEKKEIVIASVLTALESMGEDISKYLSPSTLLKDAEKGLKAKILKSFQWFDLQTVPKLTWENGKKVNPTIIQWWTVLAEKLKEPTPNGLLQRYMGLLSEKSQQTYALFLLQTFIDQDIRHPTLAEAMDNATKQAPSRLKMYQDYYNRWGKNDPDDWYARYADITLEQVIEEIKQEHMSVYLGSAIKSKGMLALAYKADGATAVKLLQNFMKQHYQRVAQITAMLTSFSHSDDAHVIQLLLGLSRRYRTKSIQELAKELVASIAERNHWTPDELADRTIPSAGLDDTGVLTLDYGTRTFSAVVDNKDKFILRNEDGKTIKSLPAPRQSEDKAVVKEAKTLFSASKKELKQVLQLQTARLYEAMCSERCWTVADWQEYLLTHPVMKRMITRLVWVEQDTDGNQITSFRPSEDGSLLNLDDDEISLHDHSHIKLAHAMLLSDDDVTAWQEHIADYEIKPLFSQLDNRLPAFEKDAEEINEFKGYVTDTFTLRGVLSKQGYQRASIEDAGSFDRYYKHYDSLGMSAVIVFSGSYVPEENIPAVVYELCFEEKQSYSWNTDYIPLAEVSPILLAESYAEYKTLADATGGFDKDWEKKTPW